MSPATRATLASLGEVEWFRNVGVRDTQAADVPGSWGEAVDSCSSAEWEDLCLEAANQYRERLQAKSPAEFARWNDVVDEVKPAVQALVRDKTRRVVADNDLPRVFIDTVDWDILHLCMEAEFAETYPPGFYASQACWYLKGHFPCGWRGPFPNGGRLVIY